MADYMELVKNSRLRETMIDRCEQELNHKETGREMRFVGGDVSKPKTNADRIRAMTDEELAESLAKECEEREYCYGCFAFKDDDGCPGPSISAWLVWLQQPAEGE